MLHHPRDRRVRTGGEDNVENLPSVQVLDQHRPRLVRDKAVALEFADGAQHTCVELVPNRRIWSLSDPGDFEIG